MDKPAVTPFNLQVLLAHNNVAFEQSFDTLGPTNGVLIIKVNLCTNLGVSGLCTVSD